MYIGMGTLVYYLRPYAWRGSVWHECRKQQLDNVELSHKLLGECCMQRSVREYRIFMNAWLCLLENETRWHASNKVIISLPSFHELLCMHLPSLHCRVRWSHGQHTNVHTRTIKQAQLPWKRQKCGVWINVLRTILRTRALNEKVFRFFHTPLHTWLSCYRPYHDTAYDGRNSLAVLY